MTRGQTVLEVLNRQEQLLHKLLHSCRTLDGRMQRVEAALGVNSATTAVNLQQLPLPRAGNGDGDQACDYTEPAYAVIPDRHTTALETIPQTHMESLFSSPAFGRAVGEAADLHSEDERLDEMAPAQPHPQSPAAPRRAISFMQRRTSSFSKVVSGIRKDSVHGSKSALKFASTHLLKGPDHSTGHFMRILSNRNGASTSALSGTIDDIEDELWDRLILSDFWQHLELCETAGIPLPFRHRLRMLTQIPHWISSAALVHMFKEQDTIGVLTNVVPPSEWGFLDPLVLFTFGVVHPGSSFKVIWDVYVMAILFSVLIATPFVICFDIQYVRISALGIWEAVVDSSLWLDMILNFRTAFSEQSLHVDNALVTGYRRIAVDYLRGFFILDFVSTVPWDLVNASLGLTQLFKMTKVGKLVRVIRMLKITKMLRVVKAPRAFKQLELRLGRVLTRVLWLICSVVFTLHIFACMFHFAALLSTSEGTWVESSGIVDASSTVDLYVTSMYWAMSTMATVGYGDVTPIQIAEKVVSMLGMLAGVTVFAYIMSTISVLLSSVNAQSIRIAERQRQLDSFCRTHKIPSFLAMKLSQYYEYVLPREVHVEDSRILTGLSGTLRQQVLLTMHAPLIGKLPVLQNKHPQFLEFALTNLKLEHYPPSEHVIWQGDMSTDMYFIVDGKLEVRVHASEAKESPGGTHRGSTAASVGPMAEAQVVPLTGDRSASGCASGERFSGAGNEAIDDDSDLPPVRRFSRQLSKLRLRRTQKDTTITNRMVGQYRGPYTKVGKLLAGEHFGEMACWTGDQRTASIVTVTSCELYSLQRTALMELVKLWPDFAVELRFKTIDGTVRLLPTASNQPASPGRTGGAMGIHASHHSDRSQTESHCHRLSSHSYVAAFEPAETSKRSPDVQSLLMKAPANSKIQDVLDSSILDSESDSQVESLMRTAPPAGASDPTPFSNDAAGLELTDCSNADRTEHRHAHNDDDDDAAAQDCMSSPSNTSEMQALQLRTLAVDVSSVRSNQALPPLTRPAAPIKKDKMREKHESPVRSPQHRGVGFNPTSGDGHPSPG